MKYETSDRESLRSAYALCRRIAAQHGRSYYLATRVLPVERRAAVHALYAFARTVDDIVDVDSGLTTAEQTAQLAFLENQTRALLNETFDDAANADPVLLALADTVERFQINPSLLWLFLDSMRMDLPGTPMHQARYRTMPQLQSYMRGSAAAIGLQLLPVLGTVVPAAQAAEYAATLGEAFQLTNFIRDLGEDLDRERLYLPSTEFAAFGLTYEDLLAMRIEGRIDGRLRRALAHFIAVTRTFYRRAEPGIELLDPAVRPGIRAATKLYSEILDRVEAMDYEVFQARAVVPTMRRMRLISPNLPRIARGAFRRRDLSG